MKSNIIAVLLIVAATVAGCGGSSRNQTEADAHEHEAHLQLTAYNNEYEVYAEAAPFVAGEEGEVLAHFTLLNNFKPLEAGKVTATLTTDQTSQTLAEPTRPGIYKFSLAPQTAGNGQLTFTIETSAGTSTLTVPGITVYDDEHRAHEAAEAAEVSSSNGVAFTKETSWLVDFSTEVCRREPFGEVIRTMAQVLPSQGDERVVAAKTSGIVTLTDAGLVDGKAVSAGQTLFSIKSGDMAGDNLSVRYRQAESEYALAKAEYERKAELAKDLIVTESELLDARARYEAAEAVYTNLQQNFSSEGQTVTTPLAGYVKQLLVSNGQYVEAGQPLATIAQNRRLLIKAEVQPRYYRSLAGVTDAKLRLLNDDKVYSLADLGGRLVSYGKSVEADSPLLPVVFAIDNTIDLLPGSFVEMFIKTEGGESALTVPRVALIEEMGNYFVYVQLTPEYFEKREVKTGKTDGERTEILAGLDGTERIVARGAALVKLAQAAGTVDPESGHHH